MTMTTPRMTLRKNKIDLYFTFEFRNYLELLSEPSGLQPYSRKYEKYAAVTYVSQNTQNLVISRCCFADDGYVICN